MNILPHPLLPHNQEFHCKQISQDCVKLVELVLSFRNNLFQLTHLLNFNHFSKITYIIQVYANLNYY